MNQCVANILSHWRDGEADKLTQLVFSDISTPTATKGGFNIYDDIRRKLFAKVRSGQVRVLIGSTAKMGAGTNCQDRLIASHDLNAPWRPRDLTQRAGRIIRQGNMNEKVHIYRYVTESTFDSYLWQTLEAKQKFISQVMTSKTPLRSCEDVDETALSFAEIKALCAGDPRIRERMELDVDVAKLRIMKADFQAKKFRMEDSATKRFPAEIRRTEAMIAGIQTDMDTLAAHPHPENSFAGMKVHGRNYLEKDTAGEVEYIIRTAIKLIGRRRTLVLYVYDRKRAAGGDPLPVCTHLRNHYICCRSNSICYPFRRIPPFKCVFAGKFV